MIIEFNLTGNDRKELVKNISEVIGAPAEYQYMPTCAYVIGRDYTVTKEGNLEINDRADSKEVEHLLTELDSRGYSILNEETDRLTVQMPRELLSERTLNRVRRIIENKGEIFKAAFKTDSLDIIQTDEKVEFPWFTIEQDGDADAYCTFISMLCKFAKNRNRINNKPDTSDNEKYAFRCFLIRLGFVGSEFKAARKVLLRNLTGSSAFRHGRDSNEISG